MVTERTLPAGAAVLVTGSSSGIGRAAAVYLAKQGFTVFATVRKEADADNLRRLGISTLVPVCPLDLTRPEHIPAVLEKVSQELAARNINGLYAIINNAGGGGIAPLELIDIEKFRTEVEARMLGPVALLQAFLPMIRQAHGRILWIATPALIPIPFVSSIHVCDFAVNCIARTLQIELKQWHIPNVLIRCGAINTPAPGKSSAELAESFQQWPKERFELYRQTLEEEHKSLSKMDEKRTDPDDVAKVIYTALMAKKPKRRYRIGHLSRLAAMVEYFPQTVVDRIMEWRG